MLWPANVDALPTRVNLVKRKVLTDPTCQTCGAGQESTLHALWSCPKLNEVWDVHFSLLKSNARECSTFLEVFSLCLEKSHPSDLFAMVAYQIWLRRNKLRLGEVVADLKQINSMARVTLQEFQQANTAPPKPQPARNITKWLPVATPYGMGQSQFWWSCFPGEWWSWIGFHHPQRLRSSYGCTNTSNSSTHFIGEGGSVSSKECSYLCQRTWFWSRHPGGRFWDLFELWNLKTTLAHPLVT